MPVNIPNREFNDIVTDSKNYFVNNSKIKNLNPTSTAKLILDSLALEEENMYASNKNQILNAYLSTSNGQFLDEVGYLFDCDRLESQRAADISNTNFRFYLDPAYGNNVSLLIREIFSAAEIQNLIDSGYSIDGTNLKIPSNTKISNLNENVIYFTSSVVTLDDSNPEGFSPVVSESEGTYYNIPSNTLIKHTLSNIPELRKISNFILCENKFGIDTGSNYEDDVNYRWRISNKINANSNANESAIRVAAFSVPGVRNVSVVRSYGVGAYRVFIEGINPIVSDGLISAVREAIERISSAGEKVYVLHPSYTGIELQVQLLFDYNANKNMLTEAARTTIIDYINNLTIGGELIINEMVQRIMNISGQIKDLNFTLFGYGNYNKTTGVNEDFIPLRLTNQTALWNEKFYCNNKMISICEFGATK